MPIPSMPSIFHPVAVYCCRCKGKKPMDKLICNGRVRKTTGPGETKKSMGSQQMEDCLHRTCPTCQWIDKAGDDVRHPIQIATIWSCGTCEANHGSEGIGGNHVVQLLRERVWCRCNAPSTKREMGADGKIVKTQIPAKRASLAAVYDQFGKLMYAPEKPIAITTANAEKVAEVVWTLRGSYYLPEVLQPGSMLNGPEASQANQGKATVSQAPEALLATETQAKLNLATKDAQAQPRVGSGTSTSALKRKPKPSFTAAQNTSSPEDDAKWAILEAKGNAQMDSIAGTLSTAKVNTEDDVTVTE